MNVVCGAVLCLILCAHTHFIPHAHPPVPANTPRPLSSLVNEQNIRTLTRELLDYLAIMHASTLNSTLPPPPPAW